MDILPQLSGLDAQIEKLTQALGQDTETMPKRMTEPEEPIRIDNKGNLIGPYDIGRYNSVGNVASPMSAPEDGKYPTLGDAYAASVINNLGQNNTTQGASPIQSNSGGGGDVMVRNMPIQLAAQGELPLRVALDDEVEHPPEPSPEPQPGPPPVPEDHPDMEAYEEAVGQYSDEHDAWEAEVASIDSAKENEKRREEELKNYIRFSILDVYHPTIYPRVEGEFDSWEGELIELIGEEDYDKFIKEQQTEAIDKKQILPALETLFEVVGETGNNQIIEYTRELLYDINSGKKFDKPIDFITNSMQEAMFGNEIYRKSFDDNSRAEMEVLNDATVVIYNGEGGTMDDIVMDLFGLFLPENADSDSSTGDLVNYVLEEIVDSIKEHYEPGKILKDGDVRLSIQTYNQISEGNYETEYYFRGDELLFSRNTETGEIIYGQNYDKVLEEMVNEHIY